MKLTLGAITELFKSNSSYFIARVGNVEMTAILQDRITDQLKQNAGFYGNEEDFKKWKGEYIKAILNCDAVANVFTCDSFYKLESELYTTLALWKPSIPFMELDINYWLDLIVQLPKVGIVSFFAKEMKQQSKNLDKIHKKGKGAFDKTHFEFVECLSTIEGNEPKDKSYFQVLEELTEECLKRDCDHWFLSCGSYGLLLGNELKKKGKNVYYVGGFLQLLFGLRGKRWDNREVGIKYNSHWKYPQKKPINAEKVEDWCYGL